MNLSRRGFFGGLVALVAAPAIIRTPGLLMPIRAEILRPRSLLTVNEITREAVRLFLNSNRFLQNIDAQYDSEFAGLDSRIGAKLQISLSEHYGRNS